MLHNSYICLYLAVISLYTRCYGEISTEPDILPTEDIIAENTRVFDVRISVYNPTPEQCDDSPLITASGSYIDTLKLKQGEIRWLAVSRDLLNDFSFGDTVNIYIYDNHPMNGSWVVQDVMNKRYTKSIDLLTYNTKVGLWDGFMCHSN